MVPWPQYSRSLNSWLEPRFRSLFSRCYDVERHFIGLLEKGHCLPKYPKPLRLQVAIKVLLGIPFLENKNFGFIPIS